jgi:dihydrodipicolinate synthase/N-acetylneuraminate lyase
MPVRTRYPQGLLVSCPIPWSAEGELCEDLFRRQVGHFLNRGFHHLYIFGTAGEGYAVDTKTFRRIVDVFREAAGSPGIFAQVGVIALSTANVLERVQIAYDAGFRTFQISLPCWGTLNDREILRFFRDVCGAYPDSGFLHYNLLRSGRLLQPADYRRLTDEIPNLVATKNTSPNAAFAAELMRTVPELQHFFGEATFPTACLHGECSLLSSFAPLFPSATQRLFDLGRERKVEELFNLQRDYLSAVWTIIAPMMRQQYMDGAYDKVLARLGGFPMPLALLSPYEAVPEDIYLECRQILERQFSTQLEDWG